MTRVWSEGFEMRDLVGYTASAGAGISTTVKRSGGASFYSYDWTSGYLNKSITAVSELYLRFATYLDNTDTRTLTWYHDATELGHIHISTGGINISTNGLTDAGAHTLSASAWFMIEVHIKIDDATGVVEVKFDGIAECDVSGDTKPGADTTVTSLKFSSSGSTYTILYLDDMAINDTAGGVDDSWCGDGKIIKLTPDDDVTTELTQYPALTDHHADVDDYPADGDTTYVQGTVVDEEDLYELSASGLVAADVDTINRVWVESRSKDTVASGGEVALFIVSNATEGTGADVVLGTTYATKVMSQEFLQDPDGPAAWDVAALDALQAGVRTRA
jgi:hypothetical protein